MTPGHVYIVATPIGNLEDITLRALRVLKDVSLIAAEDTRRTKILLDHYGISTPLISYHEHNRMTREKRLLEDLLSGKDIALVSDAGTPGISDPGVHLVRAALDAAVPVVPIPGPTALISALSISGLPTAGFVFEGFLPSRQGERKRFLSGLSQETRTLVFYESPRRVENSLQDILSILGDRNMAMCREITKFHEDTVRGRVSAILGKVRGTVVKGEVTLVIQGSLGENSDQNTSIDDSVRTMIVEGRKPGEIAQRISAKFGIRRQEAYKRVLESSKKGE